jgi:hypothetical protein
MGFTTRYYPLRGRTVQEATEVRVEMDNIARASVEGTWVRQLLLVLAAAWFVVQGAQSLQVAFGLALLAAALLDWRGFFGIR